MFAAGKWSVCNTGTLRRFGVYIWTAGQWETPKSKSKFVWKWTDDHEKPGGIKSRNQAMGYTNWYKPITTNPPFGAQPDNHGGKEGCVNLLKNYGYTWNDTPCTKKYCFICEDRTVPIWSLDWIDNIKPSVTATMHLSSQTFELRNMHMSVESDL